MIWLTFLAILGAFIAGYEYGVHSQSDYPSIDFKKRRRTALRRAKGYARIWT